MATFVVYYCRGWDDRGWLGMCAVRVTAATEEEARQTVTVETGKKTERVVNLSK